jgi:aconitate hydratase
VACQDAAAQMALLQFMHAGKSKVAVLQQCIAITDSGQSECTDLLEPKHKAMFCSFLLFHKYGIGFWKPGPVIHQVVLEIMLSGGMMIGTDSHTVNAGLGMVATWCWWC